MNFEYFNKNKFSIKVNSSYLKFKDKELKDLIKEILINVRKKYNIDIYGFFNVDMYEVNKLLYILDFEKKDNDDYFYKTIDLKITKHIKNIPILIEDFLINKENIYKMCEHYFINN